ncbi:hypothetical protein [Mycolicibacterium gadium]|uniref:hypothetical protein n=1 Tax=Mycolicibacterium gadium TaxID=1794 RepID=UPI002FDD8D34
MTLTDPREALADQSNFIGYLVGLAGIAQVVNALADGHLGSAQCRDPDDFVYALLGLASVGAGIERLAYRSAPQPNPVAETSTPATPTTRWLR